MLIGCSGELNEKPFIADVAVYNGPGSWTESVTASIEAVRSTGYSVDTIDASGILKDNLRSYNLVVFPGGDPLDILGSLGTVGRMNIRSFVSSGGGLIGLGGGATITDSASGIYEGIGLFTGDADYPVYLINTPPNYTLTAIRLEDDTHKIGRNGQSTYQTLYRDGPQFLFSDPNISVVYTYIVTGAAAGIAFNYSQGRVFLAGFQPEFEENSLRDSTDFGHDLYDSDTEWDIINRAVKYCLWEL
ncbi:hypothetical protein K9N50_03315 [bacterium]|nr:hypothetical protein [bacterium]